MLSERKEFSLTVINKPEDWDDLPDMAKKHLPIIEAPAEAQINQPFTIKVRIGGIDDVNHPNMLGHWINWIEIFADERWISRFEFAPGMCNGYKVALSLTLDKPTVLTARALCNLHGVWEGKGKKISVK
jgi:superoxide reductase